MKKMKRVIILLMCVVIYPCVVASHEGDASVVVKRSRMLMGTLVFVTVVASDRETAQRAATAGLDEIRRLEELLSTWISSSDISKINKEAGHASVHVNQETYELLQRSLEVAKLTQGGFNIAIGPAVEQWGFPEHPKLAKKDQLVAVKPLTDLRLLELQPSPRAAYLAEKGMRIDIGGIGKGFAADKAATVMQQLGATAGVVALSGDIKTFGVMPDGEQFVFGIQHPRHPQRLLGKIQLENEAVSTAGDYQQFFMENGVRYHHILDPTTLYPARGCQSVTVIAKEGVWADGLDTGIFVMGVDEGMRLIESTTGVEGLIVAHDGTVHMSSGLRGRVFSISQDAPGANVTP